MYFFQEKKKKKALLLEKVEFLDELAFLHPYEMTVFLFAIPAANEVEMQRTRHVWGLRMFLFQHY